MKHTVRTSFAAAALAGSLGMLATGALPASAQYYEYGPNTVPVYQNWQPAWDQYRYDRHHVMLGVVTDFSPYRLTVQRRDGIVQTVDLKNGTIIRPTGATPTPGERVALVGYYSNGTFIANRVILRM